MKNKLKIIILTLGCFALLGCPPHHISNYEYIGQNSNGRQRGYEKLQFDHDSEILVSCFFYYSFIGEKDKALIAKIMTDKSSKLDLQDLKIKIISSELGELEPIDLIDSSLTYWDSIPSIIYGRKVEQKNETKIRKMLANDTISILTNNGMEHHFVSWPE